jgi:hypothetical protein
MRPTKTCKVVLRNELFTIHLGSIDVGLLGNTHHKINLIVGECLLLLNEGVLPLFTTWSTSYNASLSKWILD